MSDLIVRGRYQIVPEGGGKAKGHQRITNFAKKLEDGFTLTAWKQRSTLLGAAQRPDIIAATIAAAPDLEDEKKAKDARRKLDDLAEAAMEAAKANVAREMGTALHTLTEQADSGMTVNMPSPYKEDLAAYRACVESLGMKIERMEEVVVVPELQLAGRFDRLVSIDGRTYVMDLKTGADLDYSWLSISIQLALYAQASTIYHPHGMDENPEPYHEPMPAVDQERAIVVHLPAGQAKATPYWIDLNIGRHGIELTRQVLAWRRIKDAAVEIADEPALLDDPEPEPTPVDTVLEAFPGAEVVYAPDLRSFAVARVQGILEAGHGADLAARWPLDVPTLKQNTDHTEAQLDEILAACTVVEGLHEMPFPLVSDPRLRDQQVTISKGKKGRA